MNRIGKSIFLSIVVGIFFFMAGMLLLNFLDPAVKNFMDNEMQCDTSSTLSDGEKATCLLGEIAIPYFIIIILSATGAVLVDRFLL